MALAITWLGHSTFLIALPTGQRIVTDPWLGNPKCPARYAKAEALAPVDLLLLSHGHDDHSADVVSVARATGAAVVCVAELGHYFRARGVRNVREMNVGGTQAVGGIRVTMTQAVHSGSLMTEDGGTIYLGGATGFILRADGIPTLYFAGDTALFGDMKLIGELYRPEIAFLPIGDHFTMGPDTAAVAARWLGVRQVVPMHWGTFPLLRGRPDALKAGLDGSGIDVLILEPGETAE
jgi:L-ascorbate metabolism protein UlaG (beta-lactamase superfamily)